MKILQEDEELNPILSAVNLIDVFLVIIAALMIALAQNPLSIFSTENVTVIKNAGEKNMEIIVKQGEEIEHYKTTGEIGGGEGVRAGTAYRLADGSFVYVPEGNTNTAAEKLP